VNIVHVYVTRKVPGIVCLCECHLLCRAGGMPAGGQRNSHWFSTSSRAIGRSRMMCTACIYIPPLVMVRRKIIAKYCR